MGFDFNILHTLINLLKVRIDNENDMNDRLYKYLNGIINFRSYYGIICCNILALSSFFCCCNLSITL